MDLFDRGLSQVSNVTLPLCVDVNNVSAHTAVNAGAKREPQGEITSRTDVFSPDCRTSSIAGGIYNREVL